MPRSMATHFEHAHSVTKWHATHSTCMISFDEALKILLEVAEIILLHRNARCETEWIYIHGKMIGSVLLE